jgi:hypothetical protein
MNKVSVVWLSKSFWLPFQLLPIMFPFEKPTIISIIKFECGNLAKLLYALALHHSMLFRILSKLQGWVNEFYASFVSP